MVEAMGVAAATYPSSARLKKRAEYLRLKDAASRFSSTGILVVWSENSLGYARLGLTVSKKVGNAVIRNRIKRYIREVFRVQRNSMPSVDLNVIARSSSATMTFARLQSELHKAFTYIGTPRCSRASHF